MVLTMAAIQRDRQRDRKRQANASM